jgi:hypothetical protein
LRNFIKKILGPLLTKLASNASAPDKNDVFESLTKLINDLKKNKGNRGVTLNVDFSKSKFIIFSDHHKGNKDHGDDFASNEKNYLAALDYYFSNKFNYINLGDSEELWKYKPEEVISKNTRALSSEARFHDDEKYFKTFGNHDLIWKNKLDVDIWFKKIFKLPLPVYEGLILKAKIDNKPLSVYVTHGHQGDKMSDNNGLSTWLVSHIWRPLQRYLDINVNTPAKDFELRDRHNIMMYEWSSTQKNLIMITGHTHKPVFAAGLYSDHPANNIPLPEITGKDRRSKLIPSYFNSGCCCYNDSDITGIEIGEGKISLIKWHWENETSHRVVLEEVSLTKLVNDL